MTEADKPDETGTTESVGTTEEQLWEVVTLLMDHTVQTRDMATWTELQKAKEIKRRARMFQVMLGHFEPHIVKAAAFAYLGKMAEDGRGGGKFFPSSSELLECIRDILTDAAGVPDADAAWYQVTKFASQYGHTQFPAVELWMHPLIPEAVKTIGWRNLCLGDEKDETYRRHAFQHAYDSLVKRKQREQMMVPVVRTTIMQIADAMGRPKQLPPAAPPAPALPEPTGRNYETAKEGDTFASLANEFRRYMANLPPMPKRGERG